MALPSSDGVGLPKGWTRHLCPKSGKPFFRHKSDESREFWYPIPLGLPNGGPQIRAKYLWARTRRAFLWVGPPEKLRASRCDCTDLLSDEWEWKGILRHPSEDVAKRLEGTRQELIELSAGVVLNQEIEEVSFDEWSTEECPRHGGRYDFYNVMAVERVGDVACRLAVGRVVKEAWEALATEWCEITLA